ncbi:MAG: HAD hydrolase-like protein [Pseudomonadota bacterium]
MLVFLDLDGTLTDNREGILRSIAHALSAIGHEVPGDEKLLPWIGPPLHRSFENHLGDADLAAEALGHYRKRYREAGLYENRVYDGVPGMLADLRSRGWRLALATSKPLVFARPIVEHLGLAGALDALYGSELDGNRADKTDLLAHARAEEGDGPAVMLGDRSFDMVGARNNRVTPLGALWGFGSAHELEGAGAAALAAQPGDVLGLIEGGLA